MEVRRKKPQPELYELLANQLGVKPGFFANNEPSVLFEENFFFYKLSTTQLNIKSRILALTEIIRRFVNQIEKYSTLPRVNLPTHDGTKICNHEQMESIAEKVRQYWNLKDDPIGELIPFVESMGVVVTHFDLVEETDSFAVHAPRPIIVCNFHNKSACQIRYEVTRLLSDLILHEGVQTGSWITRQIAASFADRLLLPSKPFKQEFQFRGKCINWQRLSDMECKWKVGKSVILRRAKQLALITDEQYQSAIRRLHKNSDQEIAKEQPLLIPTTLNAIEKYSAISLDIIAQQLNLSTELLTKIIAFHVNQLEEQKAQEATAKLPDLSNIAPLLPPQQPKVIIKFARV